MTVRYSHDMLDSNVTTFAQGVQDMVSRIPKGRLMTYGQIAALCGSPRAARIVGGIAHFGNPLLPWQRVVHKTGKLADGFPGGVKGHAQVLAAEGLFINEAGCTDIAKFIWWPDEERKHVGTSN